MNDDRDTDEDNGSVVVDNHNTTTGEPGKTSGMTADDYSTPGKNVDEDASFKEIDNDIHDLNYSDQSDYDKNSCVDSNDDLFTSFQKNQSPNLNRVQGGPTKPDVSRMTESQAAIAMKKYKVDWKKFTDRARHDRIKLSQSTVNIFFDASSCSGGNSDRLRPMTVVEKYRLLAGHTLVSKEIAWMHIAEEANRRRINVKTEISNLFNLYVSGDNFRVQVNFLEKNKWKVKMAAVRENDAGINIPIEDWLKSAVGNDPFKKSKGEKITPYRSQWVAKNLIKTIIKDSPCMYSIEIFKYFNKHCF